MSTTPATTPATTPVILPKVGFAKVQSVLSGDTVVLLGKPTHPTQPPPQVLFTFSSVSAPRLASKVNPTDEPGAFAAREWLRPQVIGKTVKFETLKQGATAGDRVYGWLFVKPTAGGALNDSNSNNNDNNNSTTPVHLALELVKQGWATPKPPKAADVAMAEAGGELSPEQQYEQDLQTAFRDAVNNKRGIHATDPLPLVRTMKQAVEDFPTAELVQAFQKHGHNGQFQCIIEHVFDGSRLRCQVTDENAATKNLQYAHFTLLLAGITAPRVGNPKADPPIPAEPLSQEARQFTLLRVLQRELYISLLGTDKSGTCAVGIVHHPAGNIAVELLKVGLAKLTDWSTRLMTPAQVPALRIAENAAKRAALGVWVNYEQPKLSSAAQIVGQVVEVSSGDTLFLLPTDKKQYASDNDLVRISLASVRAPRLGNERAGRPDEAYAAEAKERLRGLTIGKQVTVTVHYEREIPLQPGVTEKRPFGTVAVGAKYPDVAQVLMKEGLASTQRHRDEDPRSPSYDDLRAAEDTAKSEGKGLHNAKKEYKKPTINDLTDPRKAKAYSGSLIRAKSVKAIVDYVFHGALFKLFIPSENCYIRFAPANLRCPQPSPPAKSSGKAAEPFGDQAKCYSKLHLLQRAVEIDCQSVTNGGILTGTLLYYSSAAGGGGERKDYAVELIGAGLCTLDQRRVDYGEVPKYLMDAQTVAQGNKAGIWSLPSSTGGASPSTAPGTTTNSNTRAAEIQTVTIRLSEIRSGSHFFFHQVADEAASVMEQSMKEFTATHGTATGAPCDVKINKVVAALFDDGSNGGKSWYRAKIVERQGPGKVQVLFLDHGNLATVPTATHLRPLDDALGVDKIPPVATEASLALVKTRSLSTDEGMDAARLLQSLCWGKDLKAQLLALDDSNRMAVIVFAGAETKTTVNAELIAAGLARAPKPYTVRWLQGRVSDSTVVTQLAATLQAEQETAHRGRVGMWRYGDPGDSDEEEG